MDIDIKSYYDQNTNLFLKLSGNESTASIHQPLWFKDTADRKEALNNSNLIVAGYLKVLNHKKPLFLDLGCGVGGTIFYVLNRLQNAYGYGITISTKQVEIGTKLATKQKVNDKCKILEGSFLKIPEEVPPVHLAYAIESFVHATDARQFLLEAYRKLKPGGKLLMIDDFLAENLKPIQRKSKILTDFKDGWMLGSLLKPSELYILSSDLGFELEEAQDLTCFLPIDSAHDKLIRLYLHSFRWLMGRTSYFKSQIGGNARQLALKKGMIKYLKVILKKN